MLHSAALLDGWMTTREALERLEPYTDSQYVVIRTREDLTFFWFAMLKAEIAEACKNVEQNFGRGAQTPIGSVLKLRKSQARNVFDQAAVKASELRRVSGILLNGRQLVGVITPDPASQQPESAPPVVPEPSPSQSQPWPPESQAEKPPEVDGQSTQPVRPPASAPPMPKSAPGLLNRVAKMLRLDKVVERSNRRSSQTWGGGSSVSASEVLGALLGKVLGNSNKSSEPSTPASSRVPPGPLPPPQPAGSSGADDSGGEDAGGGRRGGSAGQNAGSLSGCSADEAEDGFEGGKAHSAESSSPFDEPESAGAGEGNGSVKNDVVYPDLTAPERVDIDVPFDFVVSLTEEKIAAVTHAPLNFSGVSEELEFDLHVLLSAVGFTVEGASLRPFPVTRLDYARSKETFRLTPTAELDSPSIQKINVQFFYKGNPVGGAYQEVAVGAAAPEPLHGGSTGVRTSLKQKAPDLTVFIDEANQSGHLAWTLESPHAIDAALKEQVDVRLGEHNGQSFAVSLLKGIPSRDHRKALVQTLRGAGREISRVIPKNVWQALEAVWRLMADDEIPRLLIISVDPHIPWELATLEAPFFAQDLLDDSRPAILSAQVIVGRWLALNSEDTVAPYPMLPPPVMVGPETMAVVVGDYLAKNGIRPLPEAEEEGKDLLSHYTGIRLNAIEDDILNLLDNSVEVNGQRVDISLMHFACHGVFNPDRPDQNGIVLNNNTRFDPTWAAGNSIGSQTHPFAFMNACEVGAAGETLGGYGGFAGAFINQGFSGFLAPLWAVHDTDAREFALAFYARTMTGDQTVGEALRDLRAGLLQNPDAPASTYVSYILYAHPDLRFKSVTPGGQ